MISEILTYALDKEGNLKHIDDVPNGNGCGCICPACKQPLQARNEGSKRMHHFAHQSGVDCPNACETSIHLLAKEKIQKAFYGLKSITFSFEYTSYCKLFDKCQYFRYGYGDCIQKTTRRFDLSEFYDTCEQEVPYDTTRRRSDLKFSSSTHPDRKPVYLEIFVTHASEDAKLHSGEKIIEAKIESENDIDEIIKNGLIESLKQDDKAGNDNQSLKVSFWGFINKDYNYTNCNSEIEFSRYILFPSGKFSCRQDCSLCNEVRKTKPNSLYEIYFHTPVAFGIHEIAKWMGFLKFGIRNCLMCKNIVENNDGDKICRLYKCLGISNNEKHDNARAKTCSRFILNQEEMEECLKKVENKEIPPITEFYSGKNI